jgi:hypothetical protein
MLTTYPAHSQDQRKKLKTLYLDYGEKTYKIILEDSLKLVKKRKHKKVILDALKKIRKNPQIGKIKLSDSINGMSYFFLNHLEKDFIGYKNVYSFYKGFRSVYRGMNIHHYNKKCVYRRGRGAPFNLIDYLNRKINCGMPKNYPRGISKYQVIEQLEKGFIKFNKVSAHKPNLFEAGKSFAYFLQGLLIPNAYGLSNKTKSGISIGLGIAAVVGIAAITVGVMFSPLAVIGIPLIAGGALAITGFLGWEIGTAIYKRIKKSRRGNEDENEN